MDETSICLWQGDAKGTVIFNRRKRPRWEEEPVQRLKKASKRTCLTHIAFICDRADVQPLLPQVIVGNCATFPARDWAALLAATPANVYLVRQKSAWSNAQLLARVINVLAEALRPFLGEAQPVLLMDACRLHLHSDVLQACWRHGLWAVCVPARLTWLLQPCDTHAFQGYKRCLKDAYLRARAAAGGGQVSIAGFLGWVYAAIRHHLQGRRWARAFEEDGFGSGQARLSMFVRRQLALQGPVVVARGLPAPEELALCFPRGMRVDVDMLLRPHQQLALPAPVAKALPAPVAKALAAPVAKARGQLLFGRRLALGAPSSSGAAAPSASVVGTPQAADAGAGPVTRGQSRLMAALAKGRPLPVPVRLGAARRVASAASDVQGPGAK